MRFQICLLAVAAMGLAACAQSPPSASSSASQTAAASDEVVTGSRMRQDPAMRDPALSVVYPSDNNQSRPYVGAMLQRSLWPFIQGTTP
jgi:hypothetical protein